VPLNAEMFLSLFWPFDHLGLLGMLALLGTYGGVYLFLRGFRMLQNKRLIQNTPLSKIRSASMGLVEVSGMATGPQTIRSGITDEPCYYYRARAWRESDSGNRGAWEQVADETVGVPFFVDDGTGRLLVYPQGARLDVHRNFREEYGGSFFADRNVVPESVLRFVVRHGISTTGMIRLEERCILPGFPLFVFGTLGENPSKNPWPADPLAVAHPLSSPSSVTPVTARTAFAPGVRVAVSRSVAVMPARASTVDLGGTTLESRTRTAHSPDHQSVPEANAQQFDLHPRAAITKGQRNQLFTISSESQREVVFGLEWEAIGCIWGGPLLALLCIYVLIASWG
jgi:hypothetical protein